MASALTKKCPQSEPTGLTADFSEMAWGGGRRVLKKASGSRSSQTLASNSCQVANQFICLFRSVILAWLTEFGLA